MLKINRKFGFSWTDFNWRNFRERLCLLQFQIFESIKYKHFKKALSQQKVLLTSSEIYYLSIKYITQIRLDRKIPGVDKFIVRSSYIRLKLYLQIKKSIHFWKCISSQKIYLIDFLRGKTLLFVPTISDRVVQYIWALTLEPVFNALYFENQMPFSFISKDLFVKYRLIIKLLTGLQCIPNSSIIFNWNIFSCFRLIFTPNYLLKVLFFPESYKYSMIDSFRGSLLIYKQLTNISLHYYLHIFHFFVLSLGFSHVKQAFLKQLYSKAFLSFTQINFTFTCLDQMILILTKKQNDKYHLNLIRKYILGSKIWNNLLKMDDNFFILQVHFLDWVVRLLKHKVSILPRNKIYIEYKKQFKQILNFRKYNIYQRVTFLEIFVQNRFYTNWFCSPRMFKKEFYNLKIWVNNNINTYRSFFKYEKKYLLTRIFKTSFFY